MSNTTQLKVWSHGKKSPSCFSDLATCFGADYNPIFTRCVLQLGWATCGPTMTLAQQHLEDQPLSRLDSIKCTSGRLATLLERANTQIFKVEFRNIFLLYFWLNLCFKVVILILPPSH